MASLRGQRTEAVQHVRESARRRIEAKGLTRGTLEEILGDLVALASRREFWNESEFPAPSPTEQQARYLVAVDADDAYALYLNVMRPGKRIPPHNHTTWACIAPVEGEERNYLFERLDSGAEPGKAVLREAGTVAVGGETGIALMPNDIHAVEIGGERVIRHLHMYGRALETLHDRLFFDVAQGTCAPMQIGVRTRQPRNCPHP
jgi:predicted metal-dependent enzyme (double-stranded beta helix superfamily)